MSSIDNIVELDNIKKISKALINYIFFKQNINFRAKTKQSVILDSNIYNKTK